MATSDLTPSLVGDRSAKGAGVAVTTGSAGRRNAGKAGQYLFLGLLSLLILGPVFLTIIQALSPPFLYVKAGRPLHPVAIDWKDRTWWSGGFGWAILRTVIMAFLFAVLQRAASGRAFAQSVRRPSFLVAVLGGALVLGVTSGPVFTSVHDRNGKTLALIVVAMVAVALTQIWGYYAGTERPITAIISAAFTGIGLVGLAVLLVGPTVWTSTWSRFDLGAAMFRSFTMTVFITVLQVVTSIASAYAFVFLRFPFKRILFAVFMATLLLPLEVTLVGNIATMRQLGWNNTMQGLVLPFGAYALGTFLIRQGFRGLPPEIRDATRIDGYGHVAFVTRFAIPLTRPVIAAFTVLSALAAWNQYLWPRTVISDTSFNTLQIQLRFIAAGQVGDSNQAIAAALVAAVPVVLLLVAFQRQIIRGLTAGAVK